MVADANFGTRFSVLHVCMGNICRSPMAERLLVARLRDAVGPEVGERVLVSHGSGTGDWHVGEFMDPAAAVQIRRLGGDPTGFTSRTLTFDQIAQSDLILTATATHARRVVAIAADAAPRTFLLREFADLVEKIDLSSLPAFSSNAKAFSERSRALVNAMDGLGSGPLFNASYDVDDPWGRGDKYFARVAEEIDAAVTVIVRALTARIS